jgi:hypothetical protein
VQQQQLLVWASLRLSLLKEEQEERKLAASMGMMKK